jgi:hypothetical protein
MSDRTQLNLAAERHGTLWAVLSWGFYHGRGGAAIALRSSVGVAGRVRRWGCGGVRKMRWGSEGRRPASGGTACGDGGGRKAADRRLYADHLCAEYFTRTEARGRTVDQWQPRPAKPDNHWLDCTVGTMVAASLCGVTLPAAETPGQRGQGSEDG